MNIEEINKWLDKEYGCSYTRLEELFDFEIDKQLKLFDKVEQLEKENADLKKQLEYLRSGEYLNQLKFERNMLENIVQNMEVSKEDKEFIDMTHRNTELLEENQKLKDRITNAIERLEALITFWKKYNPIDNTMQVEQFEGVISLLKEDNKEKVDENN